MNSHAQELILAVQTCIPGRLRAVIEQLDLLAQAEIQHLPEAERLWKRKSYVNDRLPGMGLTALHLAAKAYSAHTHDPKFAAAFNEMTRDLLAAGASPFLLIGGKGEEGMTVAMVCDGKLPPALTEWLSENSAAATRTRPSAQTHAITVQRKNSRMEEVRETKRKKKNALADAMPMEAAELESEFPQAVGY